VTATIRVGTWNIREAVPILGKRDAGLPKLVDTLAGAELDVVALQEVTFASDGSSRQLDAITSGTELKHRVTYSLSPSAFHPGLCSGLAVLSRTQHGPVWRIALPNPGLLHRGPDGLMTSWSKGLVATCIMRDRMATWIACVHGYPFHRFGRDSREAEFAPIWRALGAAINGLPAGPLVVSGDFNSGDRSLLIHQIDRRVRPVVDGALADNPALRSGDDVLYGAGLALRRATVTKTFSDHPLLSTEFAMESEAV
jgi:endonuclease/exonuclease/phosphatase family metal-dependent hydrolase